jgi:hypothetical protein
MVPEAVGRRARRNTSRNTGRNTPRNRKNRAVAAAKKRRPKVCNIASRRNALSEYAPDRLVRIGPGLLFLAPVPANNGSWKSYADQSHTPTSAA